MASNVVEIILKLTDKASAEMEGVTKKFNALSSKMSQAGKAMTLGVTAPLVAAGAMAVMAASDYEQAMGAVETVFEDAGDAIVEYSKKSSTAVGLSAADFSQLSVVTGAFLQNVGFSAAEAATETINLTERAADMAAVFNTDVTTALNAIQSGLKGEFNPLEQFGVKMNATAIEARALADNLGLTKDQLTDNHKAAAALAMMYEQTEKTVGTFAAESEGFSGQMQILKAQFEDIAQQLGVHLLPIAIRFLGFLSTLVEKFTELSPAQQKFIVYFGLIAAAVGPVLLVVAKVITIFTTIAPVISAVSGVISGGLLPAIGALIPALGGVGAALTPIIVAAAPVIAVIAVIGAAIYALYWVWTNNINGIQDNTKSIFENIVKIIGYSIDNIKEWWNNGMTSIYEWTQDMIQNIKDAFDIDWAALGKNIIEGIVQGFEDHVQWVVDKAKAIAQAIVDAANFVLGNQSPSKVMMEVGANIVKGLEQGITQNAAIPINAMTGVATATAMSTTNHNQISIHGNANNKMDITELAYQVAEVLGGL